MMLNPQLDELKIRKTEIQTDDNTWSEINLIDIKEGQIFRVFEQDGEPVTDERGGTVWEADSDGYMNERGIPTVKIII